VEQISQQKKRREAEATNQSGLEVTIRQGRGQFVAWVTSVDVVLGFESNLNRLGEGIIGVLQ